MHATDQNWPQLWWLPSIHHSPIVILWLLMQTTVFGPELLFQFSHQMGLSILHCYKQYLSGILYNERFVPLGDCSWILFCYENIWHYHDSGNPGYHNPKSCGCIMILIIWNTIDFTKVDLLCCKTVLSFIISIKQKFRLSEWNSVIS